MVDPPAPQDIARHSFDVVRRGYEQQEVRGYLHEVSALVDRLQRTEAELRERAERAEAKLGVAEQPDESMLLEVLGAETTRVLTSAHEAAAEIRAKAEASVERIVAEATAEAARLRSTAAEESEALLSAARSESEAILDKARGELDRRTEEALAAVAHLRDEAEAQAQALRDEGEGVLARARVDAEGLLEAAREQGREMVAEAQAVREKVLRDLVVRRKRARQQVEKLNAGRERLLQAYDVVRRTIDEATSELNVSLTDARIAANAAARRVEDEPDSSLEEIEAEVSVAGLLDLTVVDLDERDADLDEQDDYDDSPSPLSGEVPVIGGTSEGPAAPEATAPTTPSTPSEEAATEVGPSSVPVSENPSVPSAEAAESGSVAALDDRRSRKTKRRKGFEGLPAGELDVVAPPSPLEGVRIIPAPGESAAPENAAEPAEPAEVVTLSPTDDEVVPVSSDAGLEEAVRAVVNEDADDLGVVAVGEAVVGEVAAAGDGAEEVAETVADEVVVADAEPVQVETVDDEVQTPDTVVGSPTSSADDVFARLRAETPASETGGEVASEGMVAGDEVEIDATEIADSETETTEIADTGVSRDAGAEGPFAMRAEAVVPLEKELSRALKRALADEQNEVLDLLRRSKPKGVDDVLPDPQQHAGRWAEAAAEALSEAAAAGAGSLGGSPTSVADLASELAASLTVPLRERIDRGFVASDGNLDDIADRVRALYREWRGQRLSDAAGHYTSAAYARGVFDAIDDGAKVSWVIDPAAGACPDCDDNVLAGSVVKGEEFPTGDRMAPAHPGCHCLVLAAPT